MTPEVKLSPERVAKLRETVAEIADGPYKEMHGDTLTDARVIVMLADHYLATAQGQAQEGVSDERLIEYLESMHADCEKITSATDATALHLAITRLRALTARQRKECE